MYLYNKVYILSILGKTQNYYPNIFFQVKFMFIWMTSNHLNPISRLDKNFEEN